MLTQQEFNLFQNMLKALESIADSLDVIAGDVEIPYVLSSGVAKEEDKESD
jgi:hypothetical protein